MLKPILVVIDSRDRHYKRTLRFLRTHGCKMNVSSAFFTSCWTADSYAWTVE